MPRDTSASALPPITHDAVTRSLQRALQRTQRVALDDVLTTAQLVQNTGALIHQLQLERGRTIQWLASSGASGASPLTPQQLATRTQLHIWLRDVAALTDRPAPSPPWVHLFGRLYVAHQALTTLPELQQQVRSLACQPAHAKIQYSHWIRLCLDIVAQAGAGTTDAVFTRALAAWLQGMQAKELAGQERALGVLVWARRRISEDDQAQLLALQEEQERCLLMLQDLAPTQACAPHLWDSVTVDDTSTLAQMRRWLASSSCTQSVVSEQADPWFAACTQRMNALYAIEQRMQQWLWQWLAQRQAELDTDAEPMGAVTELPAATPTDSPSWLMQTIAEQACALQTAAEELSWIRQRLAERPTIEKAKGLLMASGLTEGQAHAHLRHLAMGQQRKMADVAADLLAARNPAAPLSTH